MKENRSFIFPLFPFPFELFPFIFPLMKNILILNGPNLNLLGKREPEIYGNTDFEHYIDYLKRWVELQSAKEAVHLDYFQSNTEGILIDKLHELGFSYTGIIFNAGAYAHTSIALADAIRAIQTPVIVIILTSRRIARGLSLASA
jgi:3-dehydroquinate dehydratase II